jgi:hypothetical protein
MAATPTTPRQPIAQLRPDKWYSKLAVHRVPATYLLGAFLTSYLILAVAYLELTRPWLAFGLALTPWLIIIFFEVEWTYRHYGWFALFFLMAVVQTIHYSEHCIEIIQYHIFNNPLKDSVAIFTKFNVEWVHFGGDGFLTLGTAALLYKFPRNPWLWIALPFQMAHQFEHNFLWSTYQFFHAKPGMPGVLGKGGLAGPDGVGLLRVDLHWVYNTLFTIPFVIALIWQGKRTYDEALEEAFPEAPSQELLRASKHLATFHYAPGETILAPGDDADRLYILSDGMAIVTEHDEAGVEKEVARLHKGQYFGEIALLVPDAKHTKTVRALNDVTVLAMDEETFRHLTSVSKLTAEEMSEIARERMAEHGPETPPAPAAG